MGIIKWIKLDLGMSDDEKMKILDSMPNRDVVHYVWIRLLIQAGKTNAAGRIFLSENIPYTREMLSIIFNRPIELIEFALKMLEDLKMINIDENNIINILSWDKHQNVESMDKIREQTRKRVEKYRAKNKTNRNETAEENNNQIDDCGNTIKIDLEESSDNIDEYDLEDDYDNTFEQNFEEECTNYSNVTVTKQNKKEKENKNKNKNKTERSNETEKRTDNDNETSNETESRKDSNTEIESNIVSNIEVEISADTFSEVDILEYINKLPKKIKGSSLHSIKTAVSIYGGENVKFAIDRALEVNKPRMNYINGILKNWKEEGYPKDCANQSKGKFRYESKKHKNLNFNNFEPRNYDYDKLERALLGW
ncbi:hypothetical protein DIC82_02415 [Clostridium beijerinckii]|nr:hypothetical protein DIC82_02415 [Clostridium beijerinckii]